MLPIRTDNTHWPTKVIRNHYKSVSLCAMFDLLHGPVGMRVVPLLIGVINAGLGRGFLIKWHSVDLRCIISCWNLKLCLRISSNLNLDRIILKAEECVYVLPSI